MEFLTGLIIGFFVGGWIGVFVMCLAFISKYRQIRNKRFNKGV